MKKWIASLGLIMLFCLSACDNKSDIVVNDGSIDKEFGNSTDWDEEETEVDINNRTIIAEVLGVEEDSRNIRFILRTLNTIKVGKIQSAETDEIDGEKVINLVAEDGTNYRIYLSKSGSIEAVKNLDNAEWPIQSKM